MSRFLHGDQYSAVWTLETLRDLGTTYAKVYVAWNRGLPQFVPVIGRIDTGADSTIFDRDVALTLGIPEISDVSEDDKRHYTTACHTRLLCYMHWVHIRVTSAGVPPAQFMIKAAFSDRPCRTVFGLDWIDHFCIAVDSQNVHLAKN